MTDPEKVFTREELVNMLADFTENLDDDIKSQLSADELGVIEKVSDGINQAFDRIDKLNTTVANLEKSNEDYRAKIAEYAADQADRMRQLAKPDDADENPAVSVLEKMKEEN